MIRKLLILLIKFYRNYLSYNKIRCCRFYPSCSEYALEAITRYGALKGGLKAIVRVARCNPLSKGGFDPA